MCESLSLLIILKELWKETCCHHQLDSNFSFSKDARLPVQLQRAMAAEAEAAREARAKVCITAT